jgi:uncharacterized protein (TIGR01777 family)
MQIAVTGGTGFVGRDVVEVLLERGDAVRVVSRDPGSLPVPFRGHVEVVPWSSLDLSGCDAVVHLAGENIFSRRWNAAAKDEIRKSRVESTQRVVEAIGRASPRPRVLVGASAVGYYGPRGDEQIDEGSPAGSDWLAQLCVEWERMVGGARAHGCRVVPVRIGVVLDEGGGALAKMLPPFRMFVGGPAGSGRQWMSWIHRRDVSRLVAFAIDHEAADGPMNATAPTPARMAEFARVLGKVLGRPSWLPTPGFALRLALGEVAGVILTGQQVLPRRALALGFEFLYPDLKRALEEILTEQVVP